jgi:hypothetical protein
VGFSQLDIDVRPKKGVSASVSGLGLGVKESLDDGVWPMGFGDFVLLAVVEIKDE